MKMKEGVASGESFVSLCFSIVNLVQVVAAIRVHKE